MDGTLEPRGPAVDDPRHSVDLMRRFAVVMLLVGGLTCASGIVITAKTDAARITQGVAAFVFMTSGVVVAFAAIRRWTLLTVVIISVVNIGVLISGSDPMGMAPMGFLWPVSYAAYFLNRRSLAAICALSTVSLGVGLLINQHHNLKWDSFIGASASVYVVAAMMGSMNRREALLRAELEQTAGTDPLTGLLNRRGFAPRMDALIDRAREQRVRSLTVVMFDLDQFKQFNDRHGHLTGDDALRRVANILGRQCGSDDFVARLGGEEFAVVMPGASATHALAYTTRVAAALRREAEPDWQLTISAGISVLSDGDDATGVLARADEALYAAKRGGRDRAAWKDIDMEVGPSFSGA